MRQAHTAHVRLTILALISFGAVAGCRDAGEPVGQPDPIVRTSESLNPCIIPVSSGETRGAAAGWGAGFTWMDQHDAINASSRVAAQEGRRVDVVLLGDSITQSWGGPGRSVGSPGGAAREKHFGQWDTLNFGISGDRTQHLLWRIENGNFEGIRPRVVVVLIGTNNLSAGDSSEQIAEGIGAVLGLLLDRLPETSVILNAVLPRGKMLDDPMRLAVSMLNEKIETLGERPRVRFVDPSSVFLEDTGNANTQRMAGDFLHLAPAGYDAWGAALTGEIERVLGTED